MLPVSQGSNLLAKRLQNTRLLTVSITTDLDDARKLIKKSALLRADSNVERLIGGQWQVHWAKQKGCVTATFDLATFWQNGGGQVVSVLAFYSDDPSSNPSTVFSVKFVFEKTKLDKKRLRLAHLKNFDKNANVNF